MCVEAAAAVWPLSCVGLGLCVEGAAVAAEVWWGSLRRRFRLERRADEWRQFSPIGLEGLMGFAVGAVPYGPWRAGAAARVRRMKVRPRGILFGVR